MKRHIQILIVSSILILVSVIQSSSIANEFNDGFNYELGFEYEYCAQLGEKRPWWTHWVGDTDRNGIDDLLDEMLEESVEIGSGQIIDILVDYDHLPTIGDVNHLEEMGMNVTYVSKYINTIAASGAELSQIPKLSAHKGIVTIEKQSEYIPLLDTSVPAMKVRQSSTYTNTAFDFGVSGDGVVIAVIDTGVDNEHNGF